jgi:hypothetical protein
MLFRMHRILLLSSFLTITAGMYNVCNTIQSLDIGYEVVYGTFSFKTGQLYIGTLFLIIMLAILHCDRK